MSFKNGGQKLLTDKTAVGEAAFRYCIAVLWPFIIYMGQSSILNVGVFLIK